MTIWSSNDCQLSATDVKLQCPAVQISHTYHRIASQGSPWCSECSSHGPGSSIHHLATSGLFPTVVTVNLHFSVYIRRHSEIPEYCVQLITQGCHPHVEKPTHCQSILTSSNNFTKWIRNNCSALCIFLVSPHRGIV